MTVDTKEMSGRVSKTFEVITNDPYSESVLLFISGEVKSSSDMDGEVK